MKTNTNLNLILLQKTTLAISFLLLILTNSGWAAGTWTSGPACVSTNLGSLTTACMAEQTGNTAVSGTGRYRYSYDCGRKWNPVDSDFTGNKCNGPMLADTAPE